MARRRFIVSAFDGDRAVLDGDEGRHLARVLRVKPGQEFELSDGAEIRMGRVRSIEGDRVEFELLQAIAGAAGALPLVLQVSLIKFNRFEWILEKAAEFGVATIVPLKASRSDSHLAEAAGARSARWRKILLSASQQARRASPPDLTEPLTPEQAFARNSEGIKLIFSEAGDAPLLSEQFGLGAAIAQGAVLAIGPEGGWTEAESRCAEEAGYVGVSLGATILRTETACLAAMAILSHGLFAGRNTEG